MDRAVLIPNATCCEELEDLLDLADRFDREQVSRADAKWMAHRAYGTAASRMDTVEAVREGRRPGPERTAGSGRMGGRARLGTGVGERWHTSLDGRPQVGNLVSAMRLSSSGVDFCGQACHLQCASLPMRGWR